MDIQEQIVENLLKPRYKVIADYPGSDFNVGDILRYEAETESTKPLLIDKDGYETFYISVEDYPHLFKKLEWWEERKLEEMPEYVKTSYDEIKKVERWDVKEGKGVACLVNGYWLYTPSIEPATLEEYNTYNTQNEKV